MTSSIRWEPVEDLKAVGELMGRLVSRTWVNVPIPGIRQWQLLGVRQPVDVYETDQAFVAELDVPGMSAEELSVSVSGRKLTVCGERCAAGAGEGKGPTYLRRERARGCFCRSLAVPRGVDAEQIKARLHNGVLVLTMPKAAPEGQATVKVAEEKPATEG